MNKSDSSNTDSIIESILRSQSTKKRILRLISLTDIIKEDMDANKDLVASDDTESLALKNEFQDIIKQLTETYLKEQRFSETFIKRQDIEQYLQQWSSLETMNTTNESDDKTSESNSSECSESADKEECQLVLEVNRTSDELSTMYHKIDKRLNAVEHKLNKMYKILTSCKKPKIKKSKLKVDSLKSLHKNTQDVKDDLEENRNIYDEMFYEWRENNMNASFYKKSEETLKLNKKPAGSQFVPPPSIADMFPLSSQRQMNRPMFIKAIVRKDIKDTGLI